MLADFAKAGLKDPEVVRLDTDVKISPQLSTCFFMCRAEDKPAALLQVVPPPNLCSSPGLTIPRCIAGDDVGRNHLQMAREVVGDGQPTVVFISTKYHVEFLFALLTRQGISATCVYGSMDQVLPPPPRIAPPAVLARLSLPLASCF